MDLIGTLMGTATLPMALASVGSVFAGLYLVTTGDWMIVATGVAGFAACLGIAPILERIVIMLERAALSARRGMPASIIAAASGGIPMLVVLGWEFACFKVLPTQSGKAGHLAAWLFSYGVATGPWTLFSQRVASSRRTLCGIRAYAGHLAYWLLSGLVAVAGTAPSAAVIGMMVPAALPFTVGYLLALADRDTLRNVRV